MKTTSRGFAIYTELVDSYGAEIRVQESSAASGSFCWIFAQGGGTLSARQKELSQGPLGKGSEIINNSVSAHLTPAMARQVAAALVQFADEHEDVGN